MEQHRYDYTTNICLLVAVASAVLVERISGLTWLFGSMGVLAGATAVATYFYNQWSSEKKVGPRRDENVAAVGYERGAPSTADKPLALFDFEHPGSAAFRRAARGRQHVRMVFAYRLRKTHEQAVTQDLVNRVVQIVERLSYGGKGTTYEFLLTREGEFTIRPMARGRSFEEDELLVSEQKAEPLVLPSSVKPN